VLEHSINSHQFITATSLFLLKVALDNSLKIADVGISKPATQITGTVAGTPIYMAPEVFESRIYDARVDIYSYGFILWEMWYGKRSFSELNEIYVKKFLKKIKDGYRPSVLIESLFPPMPDMQNLIEKCWATNPEDRLNANECVSALDSLLDCLSSKPNE
jgi:dimethylaniline monooxygenase (N-oxide forming)